MLDHPRRCGAFYVTAHQRAGSFGSSPQVRGICPRLALRHPNRTNTSRIIPAGAGHLWHSGRLRFRYGDHPRRCGAFISLLARRNQERGSSPQVRGIFPVGFADYVRHRIIPAGAGHFFLVFFLQVCCGIIPAGAGHFTTATQLQRISGDHPRRCGAFRLNALVASPPIGSSPQVRGISALNVRIKKNSRIIPAGAGHFSIPSGNVTFRRDHPRRCGAFSPSPSSSIFSLGSSPQVRGICLSACCNATAETDHPRRCGAFVLRTDRAPRRLGSSPQVRGIYSLSWNIDPKYSFLTPSYR